MNDYENMDKLDLLHELNIIHYYRDEMRHTLEKIRELFDFSFDDFPNDWNINNDEHFGDYIYGSLREYKNHLQN